MITGDIKKAAKVVMEGGVIVYPTETVYGLGADALSKKAVKRVYEIKKRSLDQPISVAVCSYEMIERIAEVESWDLIKKFLPGPVTVLLKKESIVPDILTAGLDMVGIRFPNNSVACNIIDICGPITSTSANISGKEPPVRLEEVDIKADLTVDGGDCNYCVSSTIVDLVNKKVVRVGALYDEVILELDKKSKGDL